MYTESGESGDVCVPPDAKEYSLAKMLRVLLGRVVDFPQILAPL